MVLIKYAHIITLTSMLALAATIMASCSSDMSNKTERNAIKSGNEKYKKELYVDAVKDYDKALKANPYSEAAKYDKAMATIMGATAADTSKLREARLALANLGKTASDPNISERAIYNLGNDAVFIGDYLKDLADSLRRADIQMGAPSAGSTSNQLADSLSQVSTQSYQQAISNYKAILRRNPSNIKALQNLRIAQLKLPPESQGGGSNNKDKDKDKNKQQQQQQQQQQQKQQQQQQQKPSQSSQQILNAVQNKENKTRKNQEQRQGYGRRTTDKPW